ncbi:MAG: hypothetical protein D6B27_07835 [Gammaproteobacteria bacterium]|nr:MAG: hypothetical protein D6B27_07835 [Gammaproteobacteria bacterium]
MSMYCNQCSMSAVGGCGSNNQVMGTCGKDDTLANIQDIIVYGLKGISAYRVQAEHYFHKYA